MKRIAIAAALVALGLAGTATAQQPPLRVAVDGTFAPHAMPKMAAASRASTSTSSPRSRGA